MISDYVSDLNRIVSALKIEKEPVCVKYTNETPKNDFEVSKDRYSVCGGILEASNGKIIVLSKETCSCFGGRSHLGLVSTRDEDSNSSLEFLVEGEKLWCDTKTAFRSRIRRDNIAKPPYGLSDKVYLYPISKNIFLPHLVLMLVNAEQTSRLITLNQFWSGKGSDIQMDGSLCWSTIVYPLVTGNFNVSVGDISARRMEYWDPNTIIVSIPIEQVHPIAAAIDKSTAGTAKTLEKFEKFVDKIRSRRT